MKVCSNSREAGGSSVSGTPQKGAVLTQVRELIEFARRNGYRRDDVIEMIDRPAVINPKDVEVTK